MCDSRLSVVLQGRSTGISHPNDDSTLDICETLAFSTQMPSIIEENKANEVHANHNDHDKGLWKNIPT